MARRVLVKVDVDEKNAVAGVKKVTDSIKKMEAETKQSANKMTEGMTKFAGSLKVTGVLAVAAGVALAANKLKDFATQTIDNGGRLYDLNQITGMTVETLAKLQIAGKYAGVTIEDITSAAKKLTLKLQETGPAAQSTAKYLDAIGISVNDLKKMSPEDQFLKVADAIGNVSDKSIQNKLAFELMGKSASELMPMLNGIEKFIKGVSSAMTTDMAKSFDDFGDNLVTMATDISNVLIPVLAKAAGYVNKIFGGPSNLEKATKEADEKFGNDKTGYGTQGPIKNKKRYELEYKAYIDMRVAELDALDKIKEKQDELEKKAKVIVVDPKKLADPIPQTTFDKWQTDFEQATMKKYDFEKLQLEKSRDNSIKEGQSKEQAYATYTAKLAELDKNRVATQKKDAEETKKLIDDLYNDEYEAFKEANDKIIAIREERDAFIDKSTLTSFELQRKELDADFKRFEAVTINKIALLQAYGEASKKITAEETADKTAKSEAAIEKNKTALQKWAESVQTTDAMFTDMAIKFSEGVADGIVDALDKWYDGTMKAKDAMKAFAASFLKDIAKMILQQTILNSLKSGFSSGGFLSGLIGGGGASSIASPESYFMANGGLLPGGFKAFASGGKVTKPTLGLVGEGMYNEAVVPLPDGNTIPVKLSGGSGGSSLNIVNNVTVASGSGGSDKDRQDMANKTSQAIESKVREIIGQEKRYGGLLYGV